MRFNPDDLIESCRHKAERLYSGDDELDDRSMYQAVLLESMVRVLCKGMNEFQDAIDSMGKARV